jgi:N-acyl-D-amino-acid deacylase
MKRRETLVLAAVSLAALSVQACALNLAAEPEFDILIKGGTIYDGLGGPGVIADVGLRGDRIIEIGAINARRAKKLIDASGKAVAPGFINMLSWANEALLIDGRGLSDIKQGVTLEVFGEGSSMGPLSPTTKAQLKSDQGDLKYDIAWNSLGEYLEHLERQGVAPNIASFVGAATVRTHVLGQADRKVNLSELSQMQSLVQEAMLEGAMGVGSSLIYAPGAFADTEELITLCKAIAPFGGRYISHMRSEAEHVEEGVSELITIARDAKVGAEIYHLKIGGQANWPKFGTVIGQIERAQNEGLDITANMYTYTAGATGLDASLPTWVQAGGTNAWIERLKDPATRARVAREIVARGEGWENLYFAAGNPDNLMFVGFKNPALRSLIGKTLKEVAALRGTTPENTIIDLVIEDQSRVETVYFLMSEENVRKTVQLPYVSFCSDAEASAPEGVFLNSSTHPRAYGNFARLLGRYVRDEKLITLSEAIRRLTSLPAKNLKLRERGALKPGFFADIVIFDPETIADRATYAQPLQYSVGVSDVLINGTPVLRGGEPTGAKPGRVVRGPGWRGWKKET